MDSDQAGSRRCATRRLGSLQHYHHVGGGQCDEGNAGRNSGNVISRSYEEYLDIFDESYADYVAAKHGEALPY